MWRSQLVAIAILVAQQPVQEIFYSRTASRLLYFERNILNVFVFFRNIENIV